MTDFRLIYPTKTGQISQAFGINKTGIKDFYSRWNLPGHEGVDFEGEIGDDVYAAHDGIVQAINIPGRFGILMNHAYGVHIKIVSQDGKWTTQYCHLHRVMDWVKVGNFVKAGTVIGKMGNSGNVIQRAGSDGSHLHFMLRKSNSTLRHELQPDERGQMSVYPNDIVDPTPYFIASDVQSVSAESSDSQDPGE